MASTVKYALGAAVALVVIMSGSVVHAADLAISIDTVIDGGVSAGEEAPLETAASGDLEGATCTVRSVRQGDGQGESNVGNDLVVRSGDDSVQLVDVEREPDAVSEGGEITLGPTISIALVMGDDERFGAAISVEFDCAVPATTTTSTVTTSEPASGAASSIPAGDPAEPTSSVSTPALLAETGAGSLGGTAIAAALVIVGATLVRLARRPAAAAAACGSEGR